jgi:hypothetical protein
MKLLIKSLLVASCASVELGQQDLASKFNLTQIENEVKQDIVVQLMQKDLNDLIEEKVNARVIEAIS